MAQKVLSLKIVIAVLLLINAVLLGVVVWPLSLSSVEPCMSLVALTPLPTSRPVARIAPADFRLGKGPRLGQGCAHSRLLNTVRDLGFSPTTVLDAGANQGAWSRCAWEAFGAHSPRWLMLEGSEACAPALLSSGFEFAISVLGAESRETEFYADGMSTGNSVLRESTAHFTGVTPAKTVMRTIDSIVAQWHGTNLSMLGPTLFKLDVQGYEVEVLRGAASVLELVEVLILEVSIVPYNKDAPLMAELISFIDSIGFDVLDLIETHIVNGVTIQLDFAFVRKKSALLETLAARAGII